MINRGQKCRKIKKDYQAKNLCNPFFRKNQKPTNKNKSIFLIITGIFFIFSVLWFFLFSSVWQINVIKINGLTRMDEEDVKKYILETFNESAFVLFNKTNIFLFNKDKIKKDILTAYNFSNLEIHKKLPATIIVEITERPYSFIFKQGEDYFYASRDYYIIPEEIVSEDDKAKYFILENKNNYSLINDKNKINIASEYLEFVFQLNDYLNISQEVRAEKFIIDVEFNTIKVKFKDGPLVYFNTKKDALEQLDSLILVKKEKIKDNFNSVNYIDLRYGDKIFIN